MATIRTLVPPEAVDQMTDRLLSERLAAAINSASVDSTFWWEDERHTAEEVFLWIRTHPRCLEAVVSTIEARHPYEVPYIEWEETTRVTPAIEAWFEETTRLDTE